jgi:hypothetical protein
MSKDHLRNLLRQINYVSSVTFTGGEPTLPSGINVIYDFMDICNEFGVCVGSFYIVSNAKIWRPEIPVMIYDLYKFCDDNEISMFDISIDQFHDLTQRQRMDFKYRLEKELEYKFGLTDVVSTRHEIDYDRVIKEGRGVNLASERYPDIPELILEPHDDGGMTVAAVDIYLNCDGNVICGCDWSYESQKRKENIICAASNDFETAVKKYAEVYETT